LTCTTSQLPSLTAAYSEVCAARIDRRLTGTPRFMASGGNDALRAERLWREMRERRQATRFAPRWHSVLSKYYMQDAGIAPMQHCRIAGLQELQLGVSPPVT
jgi:hypothetical protein